MHIIQDILIILLAGYMTIDQNGPVVMSWFSVIVGTISGLVMEMISGSLMPGAKNPPVHVWFGSYYKTIKE